MIGGPLLVLGDWGMGCWRNILEISARKHLTALGIPASPVKRSCFHGAKKMFPDRYFQNIPAKLSSPAMI